MIVTLSPRKITASVNVPDYRFLAVTGLLIVVCPSVLIAHEISSSREETIAEVKLFSAGFLGH